MVRFDCEKPVKHVALISDEVASSHCYLERERETETGQVCAHEKWRVWAHERKMRQRECTRVSETNLKQGDFNHIRDSLTI